jgi:hypothetical protein
LAGDVVAGIDRLRPLTADARPHPKQAIGRGGLQAAVVRDAAREELVHRNLEAIEKMLKPVNTSFAGGRRAPGMPPKSLEARLTRSKIPFSSS